MSDGNYDVTGLTLEKGARPRWQVLDILRGLAIIAMVIFHIAWDLYYFGFSDVDVTSVFGWVVFQKAILTSFLLLVGAGLVLGHGEAIRWPRFWRRFAFIAAAALATTAGTYMMFPDFFVFFGVLHAIALFSLLGLACLKLNPWLTAALGIAVIAANFAWNAPIFSSRELGWIGFWPVSPPSSDVVPIFPWFGVVLLGIAGMRQLRASVPGRSVAAWRSDAPPARALGLMGRWSLLVYVLHQPLIIGALTGLSMLQAPVLMPPVFTSAERFVNACTQSCGAGGNAAGYCQRLCQCALEQAEPEGLVDITDMSLITAEQSSRLGEISALCQSMAAP